MFTYKIQDLSVQKKVCYQKLFESKNSKGRRRAPGRGEGGGNYRLDLGGTLTLMSGAYSRLAKRGLYFFRLRDCAKLTELLMICTRLRCATNDNVFG